MELGIAGKIAIVTGAGSGIGACTAHAFADEGVSVVVADIDKEKAWSVSTSIAQKGGTAIAVEVDVTNEDSTNALVRKTVDQFGTVHILVNNAGFTRDMLITKMSLTAWDSVIDVILKGAFLCSKAVIPYFIEQNWGRIINMSSRAHLGNPGQINYSAGKAGLLGFTRALALETGRNLVTVNAIAPGIINTEALRALPHYVKVKSAAEKITPIPRVGEVNDIASAVLFLASDRASYVTGEVLHVTGGRY